MAIKQQDFIQQCIIDIIASLSTDTRWRHHGYIDTNQAILIVDGQNAAEQYKQRYRELNIPTSIEKALEQPESQKYYVKINLNQKFIDYISSKYQSAKCIESEIYCLQIKPSDDCYLLTETASILADEKNIREDGNQLEEWTQHPVTNTPLNSTNKIKINGFLAALINQKTREAIIKDIITSGKFTKDTEEARKRYIQFILEFAKDIPTIFYKEPKVSALLKHRCPALDQRSSKEPSVLRHRKKSECAPHNQDEVNDPLDNSREVYCSPPACTIT